MRRYCNKRTLKACEVIYVGDEVRDITGAKNAGVKVIAVAWGYNSRELLEKHKPDFPVDTPQESPSLFLNGDL